MPYMRHVYFSKLQKNSHKTIAIIDTSSIVVLHSVTIVCK